MARASLFYSHYLKSVKETKGFLSKCLKVILNMFGTTNLFNHAFSLMDKTKLISKDKNSQHKA